MSKEVKGGMLTALIVLPVLLIVLAMAGEDMSGAVLLTLLIIVFLAVNGLFAYLFSTQRTLSSRLFLFIVYASSTLCSTLLIGGLLLLLAIIFRAVPLHKIGG